MTKISSKWNWMVRCYQTYPHSNIYMYMYTYTHKYTSSKQETTFYAFLTGQHYKMWRHLTDIHIIGIRLL